MLTCEHVSAASLHESVVQTFASEQSRAVPEHVPLLQASFTVQYSPSSHAAVLLACEHVSAASLHESSVQPFGSAQSRGVPEHVPSLQVSPIVQYRPSSHGLPLGSLALHVSFDSLHTSAQLPSPSGPGQGGVPGWQIVAMQRSSPLQNAPSPHSASFLQPTQRARASSQESGG